LDGALGRLRSEDAMTRFDAAAALLSYAAASDDVVSLRDALARAVPEIVSRLDDSNPQIRRFLAQALGLLRGAARPALDQLKVLAVEDADALVRETAKSAVALIETP
jgi:hypothetical protein